MKVNIVTEGSWIKKFWSDKIIEYNETEMQYTLSTQPTNNTDINFYICYNTYLPFNKSAVKDVGYVTHIHKNDPNEHSKDIGFPFEKFKQLDGWIHQSMGSLNQFIELGFPKEKNYNLTSSVEVHKFQLKPIRIGIIQNGEVEGKGLFFLEKLLDTYDFKNFVFIFCGIGWERIVSKLIEKRLSFQEFKFTSEEYHNVKQSELYNKIDYLFVPSLWEGGPVAPLEAMASGVPIISSDVGFIPEFNIEYMFRAGNIQECIKCFSTIEEKVISRRKKVENLTYQEYNRKLFEILKKL